jgi:para-nitrobenzyl esterase
MNGRRVLRALIGGAGSYAAVPLANLSATGIYTHWPVYDLARRPTMIFDDTTRVENDPRGEARRLFQQVAYVQPGT